MQRVAEDGAAWVGRRLLHNPRGPRLTRLPAQDTMLALLRGLVLPLSRREDGSDREHHSLRRPGSAHQTPGIKEDLVCGYHYAFAVVSYFSAPSLTLRKPPL